MDPTTQEKQETEITALKSIYDNDFIDCPPPRAWKGAARLHEFKIRISHPSAPDKTYFCLHTTFPKTYPNHARASFAVQQPAKGLTPSQMTKLSQAINAEVAQSTIGEEMVFSIATFAQEWLESNIEPPTEVVGSLALQMTRRAQEEERARKEREEAEAQQAAELERRRIEAFNDEVQANSVRQQEELERFHARARAKSVASTVVEVHDDSGTLMETFDDWLVIDNIRFRTVKLFHPRSASVDRPSIEQDLAYRGITDEVPNNTVRRDPLGTIWKAEPVCDDAHATLPLEVHTVEISNPYYANGQGMKKLRGVETELRRLISIRHENLHRIHAVKLETPLSGSPRLAILMDERPQLTLYDILADNNTIRVERAAEYLEQVLRALGAVHKADLLHRAMVVHSVGLANGPRGSFQKRVKLMNSAYLIKLLDLHRSNQFGPYMHTSISEIYRFSEGWRSHDEAESILRYSRLRDLHGAGVIMLQMGLGLTVIDEYQTPRSALEQIMPRPPPMLAHHVSALCYAKKSASCESILKAITKYGHNSNRTVTAGATTSPISIHHDPQTPRQADYGSSPELDYFRGPQMAISSPPVQAPIHARSEQPESRSRYATDFRELEEIGQGGFGKVMKCEHRVDGHVYAIKKIRLSPQSVDARGKEDKKNLKLFREVQLLSRLSHKHIVRYHSTWLEEAAPLSPTDDERTGSDSGDGWGSGTETEREDSYVARRNGAGGANGSRGLLPPPKLRKVSQFRIPDMDERSPVVAGSSSDEYEDDLVAFTDPFRPDLSELDKTQTKSTGSFPSIYFGSGSGRGGTSVDVNFDVDSDESDEVDDLILGGTVSRLPPALTIKTNHPPDVPKQIPRILYIQMEYVPNQTLEDLVKQGIVEDTAWRLFRQVVEALVHMESLNIIHRDIKPSNIFIDNEGNCKVGDFGLATSSLSVIAEDPAPSPFNDSAMPDMTSEVGTRLYIAPEVMSRSVKTPKKPGEKRNRVVHPKADIYSVGIVFFELNFRVSTGAERIKVLEDLRRPEIRFPSDWDPKRTRQREIITWLVQHDPDKRPTALELLRSSLMPYNVEEEHFKGALRLMTQPDSAHYQTTIDALFEHRSNGVRAALYDQIAEPHPLTWVVRDTLAGMLRLHGAHEVEPPLLAPFLDSDDAEHRATFIDRHGEIVALPNDALMPFARLAARAGLNRIKRFHIGDVYRPAPVAGHPITSKAATFDIIAHDVASGANVSVAECIIVANEILDVFPGLSALYEIRISHSAVVDMCLERIPEKSRQAALDILAQSKSSWSQKRALLVKKGLLRSVVDELEVLDECDEELDFVVTRLGKVAPTLLDSLRPHLADIRQVKEFAALSISRPIHFHALMHGPHMSQFKRGVCFEIVRRGRRGDVLAAGGRYDHLISQLALAPSTGDAAAQRAICSVGMQVSVEKIINYVGEHQAQSIERLIKEQRSFGYWTYRRCDVYIVSYAPGHLEERLELATLLWRHGIAADLMYEGALESGGAPDEFMELCSKEGILFCLWPQRARKDHGPAQALFKIKNLLTGQVHEVSRAELVRWLQHELAEQKRVDATTAGAPPRADSSPIVPSASIGFGSGKAAGNGIQDVALVLPADTKKGFFAGKGGAKKSSTLFSERAYSLAGEVRAAASQGMPLIAVDVSASTFDLLCRSTSWLGDEDAWKAVIASFPIPNPVYALQIREAVNKRRAEGIRYILLFAVREERVHLLKLC
ncbi:unnamed protein product [Peniophora sp. CBMAI 1063]|nr:unnamed protein product [Peniophora sp. CBMAI 1063]